MMFPFFITNTIGVTDIYAAYITKEESIQFNQISLKIDIMSEFLSFKTTNPLKTLYGPLGLKSS